MLCIFILYVLVQRKYLHASAIYVLQAVLQCIYSIFIYRHSFAVQGHSTASRYISVNFLLLLPLIFTHN